MVSPQPPVRNGAQTRPLPGPYLPGHAFEGSGERAPRVTGAEGGVPGLGRCQFGAEFALSTLALASNHGLAHVPCPAALLQAGSH